MIFNTAEYGVFLLTVFVAFWLNVGLRARWAALALVTGWCVFLMLRPTFRAEGWDALAGLDVVFSTPVFAVAVAIFGVFICAAAAVLMRLSDTRTILLLGVSYVFYASWNPTLLFLIWFSSSLDYLVGRRMARLKGKGVRRALLLALSIATNMSLLLFFKYAGFFYDILADLCVAAGLPVPPSVLVLGWGYGENPDLEPANRFVFDLHNIILPVGISFYTFQTMSYIIDVYRQQVSPARSYFEYLVYVSFFPQLVAGPIVRARDFLPQFRQRPAVSATQGSAAVWLILCGLFKKIVIADYLAVNLVDRVFENPVFYSSLEILFAIYSYSLQIYCDFSGYSDIAIGSALLLGFRLNVNFLSPYKAVDLRDFWRRWHISLSTWFRDYLYIPLGGDRRGLLRTYFNLWLVMFLCALWHGASWTFIAWGMFHGLGLVALRVWQKDRVRLARAGAALASWLLQPLAKMAHNRPDLQFGRWLRMTRVRCIRHVREIDANGARADTMKWHPAMLAFSTIFTFHFVSASWIFFRCESFELAGKVFDGLLALEWGTANLSNGIVAVMALGFLMHYQSDQTKTDIRTVFTNMPAYAQGILIFLFLALFYLVAQSKEQPFIYFQF